MAFELQNWSRSTNTSNAGLGDNGEGGMSIFTYQSAADNIAAVKGANYFSDIVYELSVGDLIYARGSDDVQSLEVTVLDRAAGTLTVALVNLGV